MREDILTTIRRLSLPADGLGGSAALEQICRIAREGNDAGFLRRERRERGTVEGAVDSALHRFRE